MSGGKYNYAYSRIDEHGTWASTLADMAQRVRDLAMDPKSDKFVRTEPQGVGTQAAMAPLDMGDRAKLMLAAHRLDVVAQEIRKTHEKLFALQETMHSIEWIASGDSIAGDLVETLVKEEEKRKR